MCKSVISQTNIYAFKSFIVMKWVGLVNAEGDRVQQESKLMESKDEYRQYGGVGQRVGSGR